MSIRGNEPVLRCGAGAKPGESKEAPSVSVVSGELDGLLQLTRKPDSIRRQQLIEDSVPVPLGPDIDPSETQKIRRCCNVSDLACVKVLSPCPQFGCTRPSNFSCIDGYDLCPKLPFKQSPEY